MTSTLMPDISDNYTAIHPPGHRFIIDDERVKRFKRFQVTGKECKLKILQPPDNVNHLQWVEGALYDIVTYITESCSSNDHVGVTINYEKLTSGPIWGRFRSANTYSPSDLWNIFSKIAQSTNGISSDDNIIVTISVVQGIEGGRRNTLTHEKMAKKSILKITNTDNLCLPRSLVVANLYAERGEIRTGLLQRRWKTMCDSRCNLQREEALQLVNTLGICIPKNGCGINEIASFQRYFTRDGIAIVVFEFHTFGTGGLPIFDGRRIVQETYGTINRTLYILYYHNSRHYEPILNLAAAIGAREYCTVCNKSYSDNIEHRCSNKCPKCTGIPVCNFVVKRTCNICNRWFSNDECFKKHLEKGSALLRGKNKNATVCNILQICKSCCRIMRNGKNKHKCCEKYCRTCACDRPINHYCFMSPLKKKSLEKVIFLFYDFETQQHQNIKGDNTVKIHMPNLCVVQKTCTYCASDIDIVQDCLQCGKRVYVFHENPVGGLVELALQPRKDFNKIICIAHNARSFDAQFVLRYLIEHKKTRAPKLILNGSKIIVMTIGNTIFLDSLNYLQMPLRSLSKAFGFENETVKGFFPHLFNIPENEKYIGPIPSMQYFSPDTMHVKERESFISWYNEKINEQYTFNFQNEITRYCQDDVTVLRRACMLFRSMIIKCGNVCPFSECCTIASTCSKIFRRNFLEKNTIGVLPPKGAYRWSSNQSRKAIMWLVLEEQKLGCTIKHAARNKETRIPCGILVDGYYYNDETLEEYVYQFYGCYWHGCPICFRINRDNKLSFGDTFDERLEVTKATAEKIRSLGYILIEKWECSFDQFLKNTPSVNVYLRTHPLLSAIPLDPRDAFFGGRTENFVSLYDVTGSEKIKYVDVCSLYPYICKTGKFPVGHPKIYVGNECREIIGDDNCLDNVEGLVKCTILPPRDLFHPVLPVRLHGKLLFVLCRTCAETLQQSDCCHDNQDDRMLLGTWVVDEIRKAIEKGYTVIKIFEIWQYEIVQYNRENGVRGLFTDDINTFLKIKQESSGWPVECINDSEAQDLFIHDYEKAEGIKLEKDKIVYNPGLRSVAKLFLNSLWGKFGQRENLPQTEIVTSRAKLLELLTNSEIDITGLLCINDDSMYVSYVHTAESLKSQPTSNVVIAAYTTTQARLKLYTYLEQLDERALYCDTDSVIYISDTNTNDLQTGNFLGDLTDELETYGTGSYIKSFVSGGPKFYAYIVRNPDSNNITEVCKVKGITLNFDNSKHINYNTIRSLITCEHKNSIVINFDAIRRTSFHNVVTRREVKTTKIEMNKRRFKDTYSTLPFGFRCKYTQ